MNNKDSLQFFSLLAKSNPDDKSTKIHNFNDFTKMDVEFILRYVNEKTTILDLGSGSGMAINMIFDKVANITAVEAFAEFSKFIIKSNNVEIKNVNIVSYKSDKLFDLITMFGIVQYFQEQEVTGLYNKYYKYLKPGGKLIIKGQFGVDDDVTVSGFSDELKTHYYSQYRHLDKEKKIIESNGFVNIEIFDIYPPECNRWANTHFFAIVAEKP